MFVPAVGHIVVLGPLTATLAGGPRVAVVGGGMIALVGALIKGQGPGSTLNLEGQGYPPH